MICGETTLIVLCLPLLNLTRAVEGLKFTRGTRRVIPQTRNSPNASSCKEQGKGPKHHGKDKSCVSNGISCSPSTITPDRQTFEPKTSKNAIFLPDLTRWFPYKLTVTRGQQNCMTPSPGDGSQPSNNIK